MLYAIVIVVVAVLVVVTAMEAVNKLFDIISLFHLIKNTDWHVCMSGAHGIVLAPSVGYSVDIMCLEEFHPQLLYNSDVLCVCCRAITALSRQTDVTAPR